MRRVVYMGNITLSKAHFYVGSGGAGEAIAMAIYSDSSGSPGTKVSSSDFNFIDLSGGTIRDATWGSTVLTAGTVYWVGFSSEGTTAQFITANLAFGGYHQFLGFNASKPGFVSCSNPATGAGATLTLPSTCGTATAIGTYNATFPIVVAGTY